MCFPCFPGDLWNPSNKCPWRAPGLALQWLAPGSAPLWVQSCSFDLPSSHSIWTGQRRTIWRSDAFASKLKRWPRGELRTRSNLYNQVFEGVDHNLKKNHFSDKLKRRRGSLVLSTPLQSWMLSECGLSLWWASIATLPELASSLPTSLTSLSRL